MFLEYFGFLSRNLNKPNVFVFVCLVIFDEKHEKIKKTKKKEKHIEV